MKLKNCFLEAKNLFKSAADEMIRTMQSEMREIQSKMLEAKQKIDSDDYSTPTYQNALQIEEKGNLAYNHKDFEKTAEFFQKAQDLFEAVQRESKRKRDAVIDENDIAGVQADELLTMYKEALQKQDLKELNSLLNLSKREQRSWRDFFQNALNIHCRIDRRDLQIYGAEGTLELNILISYLNKHSRKQENREIPMTWRLRQVDGSWVIISR